MSSFIKSVKRIIYLSRKPSLSEFWLSLKVCLLGLLILGSFAFVIQLMSTVIQALPP
ncbi:MAG: protein translocase SEC61 complex subunit gamma [Candidatus Methanomethylicota archaeon]|uniref:Protein translocase SEC61 complex subunit gamma n=1 Tax=Thermoproteota archaeon TaxID=2056631 RepID=A0A497EYP7_9CREN|nr:MAG: protein translocase SEC61 complex subunit gamma [Candidatus Verstraetearchaeota archaeon]RLE55912.1 MAG: protein translocase SEC61 complex subunit gamma [Candidatus Verstraetearchaeota archaeon]